MDIVELKTKLAAQGYEARTPELLAVAGAMNRNGGARSIILTGAPGCGKTALAETVAKAFEAPCVYHLLHAWSSDEDLHRGVDVVAAVAGDSANVSQPGTLAVAAELSNKNNLVVLCLDELDKANERVDALLLDFLQNGRVPVKPGIHVQANLSSLLVFITSNDARPLSEALLRRSRRVAMQPLPAALESRLVAEQAGVSKGTATLLVKAAQAVRDFGETCPCLPEIVNAAKDLAVCESASDAALTVQGWLCKEEEENKEVLKYIPAIWGEYRK